MRTDLLATRSILACMLVLGALTGHAHAQSSPLDFVCARAAGGVITAVRRVASGPT